MNSLHPSLYSDNGETRVCISTGALQCLSPVCYPSSPYRYGDVAVDIRLDGNLFDIRRLQATTKLSRMWVLELQYADECALVSHATQDLQSILAAVTMGYSRMELSVNTTKTEVVCRPKRRCEFVRHTAAIPVRPLKSTADFEFFSKARYRLATSARSKEQGTKTVKIKK